MVEWNTKVVKKVEEMGDMKVVAASVEKGTEIKKMEN
jgi:hypothetical protein